MFYWSFPLFFEYSVIFQYNFYHKSKCFKGQSDVHELYLLVCLLIFSLVPVLKLESILASKWMKWTGILYYTAAVTFQFNYVSVVKSFIDLLGIIINVIWLWCWALTCQLFAFRLIKCFYRNKNGDMKCNA